MKCKFPDQSCADSYFSSTRGRCCRLAEWKDKRGVCPYDKSIKAPFPHKHRVPKAQTRLI
jgi:hypothetical protein